MKVWSILLVSSDPQSQNDIDKLITITPFLLPYSPSSNCGVCRVSFHSVKDSSSGGGGTGTSSDHDPADRELLSSSLPTPPPPPAQVSIMRGG